MPAPRLQPRPKLPIVFIFLALVTLSLGCSIHEQKSETGDKKVDIKTPFGQIKVNTEVDVKDTGLPVYPGARRAATDEHDKNSANVNISSGMFGLKVVAVKFETDDPPEKVVNFYRDKVKAYGGKFLECTQAEDTVLTNQRDGQDLTCGNSGHRGNSIELKAGNPDRQHVVAVKPRGGGSEFTLVYVNKHGKEGEL